jgi:hypothetical protein
MSGAVNYKNGRKNNWRRWQWNEVADRVRNRQEALVLYLPGDKNLDLPEAQRRGFQAWNMIAVEKDRALLRALRAAGQLTVQGDLFCVMGAWPHNIQISAVIADFTHGFYVERVSLFAKLLTHPAFVDAVFSVNLLRGMFDNADYLKQINRGKHRGELFALVALSAIAHHFANGSAEANAAYGRQILDAVGVGGITINTYRSGTQTFDSAVFKNPIGKCMGDRWRGGVDPKWHRSLFDWPGYDKQRRLISAVLAHRTMRFQ